MKGQIIVKLSENTIPIVEFLGKVDATDIQATVYYIRMGYNMYIGEIGKAQRIKAEAMQAQKEAKEQERREKEVKKLKVEEAKKVLVDEGVAVEGIIKKILGE